MTDLELTKLCAEASRIEVILRLEGKLLTEFVLRDSTQTPYDPLRDDAQAMALVKKFHIDCEWTSDTWISTCDVAPLGKANTYGAPCGVSPDLNRAIVECCAKLQAAA